MDENGLKSLDGEATKENLKTLHHTIKKSSRGHRKFFFQYISINLYDCCK